MSDPVFPVQIKLSPKAVKAIAEVLIRMRETGIEGEAQQTTMGALAIVLTRAREQCKHEFDGRVCKWCAFELPPPPMPEPPASPDL